MKAFEQEIDVLDLFRRAALLITERSYENVTYGSTIAELGIDSVRMAHIIAVIEDDLEIDISGPRVADITTIRELSDLVQELVEVRRSKLEG